MSRPRKAVLYARVSSKEQEQEQEGYSIPAQCKLLRSYASRHDYRIVRECIDVETAKELGRTNFSEMSQFFKEHPDVRTRHQGVDGQELHRQSL